MPRYVDFENRAERKRLMEEFRKEASGRNIPGYELYAQKMEALDALMDEYCELDVTGLPRTMTAEMKEKLDQAMRETAVAGEEYLRNAAGKAESDPSVKMKSGMPGMVQKLQGLLAKDRDELKGPVPTK